MGRALELAAGEEDRLAFGGSCRVTVHGDWEVTAYDDCQITIVLGRRFGQPARPAPPSEAL